MMDSDTIFDLQQSREDAMFIAKNADIELEVGADIIETVENIPYIGSLLKSVKVALSYIDYRFFRKLGRFMKRANEIPEEKVAKFLSSLTAKDKKRISDYLTQLLYTAEEEDKADLMGKIYVRRVYGEIDNDMMLRLCSIVNRAYISDLGYLGDYREVSDKNTYITDNLVALGILADVGNIHDGEEDGAETLEFVSTQHTLNEVGVTLYQILTDRPVKKILIPRVSGTAAKIGTMTTAEMEDIEKLFPTQ